MGMTTMKLYTANEPANRFWRHGKYIVPLASLLPIKKRIPAPKEFLNLAEAASSNHPSIKRRVIGTDRHFHAAQVVALQGGVQRKLPLPAMPFREQSVYQLTNGASVGRHCCLMTEDGFAVEETTFHGKYGPKGVRHFSFLDPRHWIHKQRGNLTARMHVPAAQKLPGTALALNNCACHNYYHWLTEIAPRIVAGHSLVNSYDHYIVDHQAGFQKQILHLLGIDLRRCIQPHCELNLLADALYWANEPGDYLLNSFAREILRNRGLQQDPHRKIYISRRKALHRRLENESELETALSHLGFESHCMEDLSFQDQVQLIASASHLVSVHGAALANTMFASSGLKVVELIPEGRPNFDLYPNFSRLFGHHHVLVIAQCSKHRQKLYVDPREVVEAVSLADSFSK